MKRARVYTNDPSKKVVTLTVKAFIKVPIQMAPRFVNLSGKGDRGKTRVVQVEGNLGRPLELTPDQYSLSKRVKYAIEEVVKGKKYQIRFNAIPGIPGAYHGFLKLKTNYPERPELIIWIRGRSS